MARSKGIDFRRPQGNRRLAPFAPAQIAAFAVSSFLIGTATAGAGFPAPVVGLAVLLVSGAAFIIRPSNRYVAVLVQLACLAGIFYYHLYFAVRAERVSIPFDVPIVFSGTVFAEPGHSAKSEYFPLRLSPPNRGVIRVVAPPGSGFRYGDALEARGRVQRPEDKRDLPVSIFPKLERVGAGQGSPVRQVLSDFKHNLLKIFPLYLPAVEAAFLGGITLGARASFSPEFVDALSASGTTHLVALSGYNIAILVFVVFGGCLHLFGRRSSFYITTIAILVFVAMVGAEPSVGRPAAMGFVVLLARELGRPYGLPHALLWTAFFMVLFNPGSLFMPGFQLSFISLLGIVYLSPVILKRFAGRPDADDGPGQVFGGGFRENAALTISAQLAVVPVVLHNFGSVSLTSVLANALILPFMPITMFFGFALLACGLVFPPLGFLAGLAGHVLLAYEIAVINLFSAFSLPVTASLVGFGILAYYLLLITIVRRHQLQENEKRS